MNSIKPGFRFAPSILIRLGEELVPNLDQAIIELIRNSYDADASKCEVEIKMGSASGTQIIVSDDGIGMTADQIINNWLVLGGSSKENFKLTSGGRRTVGDKGLGRLAALRAGSKVTMITRQASSQKHEALMITIDWSKFDNAVVVEDVPLEIHKTTRSEIGTTTIISDVKSTLGKIETDRLGRSIVLLTSPFKGKSDFSVELKAPDFPDLEARVKNSYLDDADFILRANILPDGSGLAEVTDFKGEVLYSTTSESWLVKKGDSPSKYNAPPTFFELYCFILTRNSFSGRGSTIADIKDWLRVVGGVHFYHRSFRVPPYGDAGHDWLDMNLARVRNPEERPSTNTSVGRVIVEDPNGVLKQKTDRVGFIESEAFTEIRRFSKDALEWLARSRLRDAEKRRDSNKVKLEKTTTKEHKEFVKVISDSLPTSARKKAIKAFDQLERNFVQEIRATREDLVLYRSLATAGTTAAVFAHEIGKPISTIRSNTKSLLRGIRGEINEQSVEKLESRLNLIIRATEGLDRFALMQIDFLKREKRRQGAVNVNKVINNIHNLWQPILEGAKITLNITPLENDDIFIYGAEVLLETIITNCLTNCVHAFERNGSKTEGRKVEVVLTTEGDTVSIEIKDNGPGVDMNLDEIWLPGRTSREGGTGFGLTIVKDSVLDLGGKHSVRSDSASGAVFRFVFPVLTKSRRN